MKKTLVSALTTALVVGAASTTFAAANPFEDVPADHWAYDAIAQLAADGVIEGYGDGTYRGDQEITRYEMAQMIARAMAKGGGDKALIDKLAAEFADELNNLGVRVSALEKKVDNVKWKGEIRYQFSRYATEGGKNKTRGVRNGKDDNRSFVQLRLKPSFAINKNWTGYAGIYIGAYDGDGRRNLIGAENITGNQTELRYAYTEGVYGNTRIELGKTCIVTAVDEGMILDDRLSGGRVTFGKDLKFSVAAGRTQGAYIANNSGTQVASSYVGGELTYNKNNFFAGVGYHYFGNKEGWQRAYGDDSANIWVVGLGYKFSDFRLYGAYAQNTQGQSRNSVPADVPNSSAQRKAYTIQLEYKGAKLNKPGSFGLEAGYRHLGQYASLNPTYDYTLADMKGWFVGGKVTLMPNVTLHLGYSNGKTISDEKGQNVVYSRFQFFF